MSAPVSLIALLYGPDRPGIVSTISGWIFDHGGNILHADLHRDGSACFVYGSPDGSPTHHNGLAESDSCVFFQRMEWIPSHDNYEKEADEFTRFAEQQGMCVRIAKSSDKPKLAVFVSKLDHCYHDLILRQRSGELRCDISCVISNHNDLSETTRYYGIPFHYIPVNSKNKESAEQEQLEILKDYNVEFAVLARYMQVLSGNFLRQFAKPVVNIHHSFLPAFAGGKPYHQAHARGVKLIGATAHYVTEVLDDGPIIHQDVARVSHRQSVDDLIRLGKNLEKVVFSQALFWHLEHRVLSYGGKTVVFD